MHAGPVLRVDVGGRPDDECLYRPGRPREDRRVDALMQRDSARQQLALSVDEFYHGAFLDCTG